MIGHGFKFLMVALVLSVGFFSQATHAGAWAKYNAKIAPLFESANARLDRIHHPIVATELGFTVELKQSGEVREVVVITSSGSDELDAAAVKSALDLSPLPTPPASVFFRQFFTPLTIRYKFNPKKAVTQNTLKQQGQSADQVRNKKRQAEIASKPKPQPSELVLALQTELSRLGFEPGPVDGYFGRKTEAAIKNFQRHDGLPVNGKPSNELLQMLRDYDDRKLSLETTSNSPEFDTSSNSAVAPVLTADDLKSSQRFYEDYEYIDPSAPKVYEDYEFIDQ